MIFILFYYVFKLFFSNILESVDSFKFCSPDLNLNNFITSNPGIPPPPLRLSLPLVTLRRFGFSQNSLFKVEAGRKAPRGEGFYIFRLKRLREFRYFFEVYYVKF